MWYFIVAIITAIAGVIALEIKRAPRIDEDKIHDYLTSQSENKGEYHKDFKINLSNNHIINHSKRKDNKNQFSR